MAKRILVLVGSLRVGSHNRQLAEAAGRHAPRDVEIIRYEGLADLPYYNEDLDVGAAFGAYGGVWAHDDVRKAVGIAGGVVVEHVTLSVPHSRTRFADLHPAEDSEVAGKLSEILVVLAGARAVTSTTR